MLPLLHFTVIIIFSTFKLLNNLSNRLKTWDNSPFFSKIVISRNFKNLLFASFYFKKIAELFFVYFYSYDMAIFNMQDIRPNYNFIYHYRRNKYVLFRKLFHYDLYFMDERGSKAPLVYTSILKYTTLIKLRLLLLKRDVLLNALIVATKKKLKLDRLDLYVVIWFHGIFCSCFVKDDFRDYIMYSRPDYMFESNFHNQIPESTIIPHYYKSFFYKSLINTDKIIDGNLIDFWVHLKKKSLNFWVNYNFLQRIIKKFGISTFYSDYWYEFFFRNFSTKKKSKRYANFIKRNKFLKSFFSHSYTTHFSFEYILAFILKWRFIRVVADYKQRVSQQWPTRFKANNLTKIATQTNFETTEVNYKLFFIRKNRIFNKSRYSRNRQLYRTGFYWCLWLSIFLGFSFLFIFYRFTINFGYFWWLGYFIISAGVFNKAIKYHLYNVFIIVKEVKSIILWLSIFLNFFFKKFNLIILAVLHFIISTFAMLSRYNVVFFYITKFFKKILFIYLKIVDFYTLNKLSSFENLLKFLVNFSFNTVYFSLLNVFNKWTSINNSIVKIIEKLIILFKSTKLFIILIDSYKFIVSVIKWIAKIWIQTLLQIEIINLMVTKITRIVKRPKTKFLRNTLNYIISLNWSDITQFHINITLVWRFLKFYKIKK